MKAPLAWHLRHWARRSRLGSQIATPFQRAIPMKRLCFPYPLALFTLATVSFGQGETCANPTVLNGLGAFPFDTTGFADSLFEEQQSCTFSGGPGQVFAGDGFFSWTVPTSGDYQFVAEGFTPIGLPWNIQMAIYDGFDCSATCLQSDDNTGPNQQAPIGLLDLTAGDQLLIQVGGYSFFNNGNPTVFDGPGLLAITERPAECQGTVDDVLEDNDICQTAVPLTPGLYSDLFLSIEDPDFYTITVPPQSTLSVELLASDLPISFFVFDQACSLIDIQAADWIRTNASNQPETIIIHPRRSNQADAIPCTTYALELVLEADTCSGAVKDAFEPNDFFNTGAPLGGGFYSPPSDLQALADSRQPADNPRVAAQPEEAVVDRKRPSNHGARANALGSDWLYYYENGQEQQEGADADPLLAPPCRAFAPGGPEIVPKHSHGLNGPDVRGNMQGDRSSER